MLSFRLTNFYIQNKRNTTETVQNMYHSLEFSMNIRRSFKQNENKVNKNLKNNFKNANLSFKGMVKINLKLKKLKFQTHHFLDAITSQFKDKCEFFRKCIY